MGLSYSNTGKLTHTKVWVTIWELLLLFNYEEGGDDNNMFGLVSKKRMIRDLQELKDKANKSYEECFEEGKKERNRDIFQYNLGECNVYNYLIDVYLK